MSNRSKYDNRIKERALNLYLEGKGLSEVARYLDIPVSTVGTWLSDYKSKENTKDKETQSLRELLFAKEAEINKLNMEIGRLQTRISDIEEEAKKEVNILKCAMKIMIENN